MHGNAAALLSPDADGLGLDEFDDFFIGNTAANSGADGQGGQAQEPAWRAKFNNPTQYSSAIPRNNGAVSPSKLPFLSSPNQGLSPYSRDDY